MKTRQNIPTLSGELLRISVANSSFDGSWTRRKPALCSPRLYGLLLIIPLGLIVAELLSFLSPMMRFSWGVVLVNICIFMALLCAMLEADR